MIYSHKSVMLDECISNLCIKPNGVYVDCTCGGGGHSAEILKQLSSEGKLVCIDRDAEALEVCIHRFSGCKNVLFAHCDFKQFDDVLDSFGIGNADGFLADLGVSSYQIDNPERGFSYMSGNASLDMRMDATQKLTAEAIVNTYSELKLCEILKDYGEENFASVIAKNIAEDRTIAPIKTCGQLVAIIDKSIPAAVRRKGGHPAKRTFQALRIEVNKELDGLDGALRKMCERLNSKGRIAVLTFQSLEDRIVKHCFADMATGCICPPSFPVCVCGHKAQGHLVNKKPLLPTTSETESNPRSQSAKLRVFEKDDASY